MHEHHQPYAEREVAIPAGTAALNGELVLPAGASAVVVLVDGDNETNAGIGEVAHTLQRSGLGTLRVHGLTQGDDGGDAGRSSRRPGVARLAERVMRAMAWVAEITSLRTGCFAMGAGTAPALAAAAKPGPRPSALVCAGGRVDLAAAWLADVAAPTQLIVGGADSARLSRDESAYGRLKCVKRLVVVPGAGPLFTEYEAQTEVAALATDWFLRHLEGGARA